MQHQRGPVSALSGSHDKTVRLWDLGTGDAIRILKGQDSNFLSVAMTVDGTRALSGSDKNTVTVWDLGTGDTIHILKGHLNNVLSVALSADGTRALSRSGKAAKVWDLSTGKLIRTLKGHTENISSVAISSSSSPFCPSDAADRLAYLEKQLEQTTSELALAKEALAKTGNVPRMRAPVVATPVVATPVAAPVAASVALQRSSSMALVQSPALPLPLPPPPQPPAARFPSQAGSEQALLGEGTATARVTPPADHKAPWIWGNGPIVGQIRGLWVFWRYKKVF